jgi:hypothetical protein
MLVEGQGIALDRAGGRSRGRPYLSRPLPQPAGAAGPEVDPDAEILLYVGGMDAYHIWRQQSKGSRASRQRGAGPRGRRCGAAPLPGPFGTRAGDGLLPRPGRASRHTADAGVAPYSVAGFPGGIVAIASGEIERSETHGGTQRNQLSPRRGPGVPLRAIGRQPRARRARATGRAAPRPA